MARRKYTEAQAELAAELREKGLSIGDISSRVGMTEQSVQYHCLRLGADLPPEKRRDRSVRQRQEYTRNGYTVRRFTPEEDQRLLDLEASGAPVREIARQLGRPRNSTQNRLMTLAQKQARAEEAAHA